MSGGEIAIIPVVSLDEAFRVFAVYVEEGLVDCRGQRIEVDFGNYTHVISNEERVKRTSWIRPTVETPDEVWRSRSRKPKKRERRIRRQVYLKWIAPDRDTFAELFVVATELLPTGQLRLRSWYSADDPETAWQRLREGERIWPEKR